MKECVYNWHMIDATGNEIAEVVDLEVVEEALADLAHVEVVDSEVVERDEEEGLAEKQTTESSWTTFLPGHHGRT